MKRICFLLLSSIFIPYFLVTFIHTKIKQTHFQYEAHEIVRVKREESGMIEEVPLEEYIMGVLAGEMPLSFNLEALKAQAVASRSYVMKKMEQNRNKEYDIVDTIQNQVYLSQEELKEKWKDDYQEKSERLKQVVQDTLGEYLAYDGEVIEAFFFSTSSGMTENSGEVFQVQLPYLISVKSEWDQKVSPVFSEKVTFSSEEFYKKLNIDFSENLEFDIVKTTSTGRIKEALINGTSLTGNQICARLNLRSTYFSIKQDENEIIVTTKGYGHGVGMSQYGALAMAQEGYSYKEILKYYYQGVEIQKI